MNDTIIKQIAISEEVRNSIRLIEIGLGNLQRIDGSNDFYHAAFLTLSSGFERLMKIIICFYKYEVDGNYPTMVYFKTKGKGHDLVFLLEKITKECFNSKYLNKVPAARKDIMFLNEDEQLLETVKILTRFGLSTRYYNLNIVLGVNSTLLSSEQEWKKLESTILDSKNKYSDLMRNEINLDEAYSIITTNLVIRLEMFARALVRLFTLGGLGVDAKRNSGFIKPFLNLMDRDLGKRKYPTY